MRKSYKIFIFIFIILILHFLLSLVANSTPPPILGDVAFHTSVIEKTVETGYLQSTAPNLLGWFGYPRFAPFYIVYPPFQYTFWSVYYPIIGQDVVFYSSLIVYLFSILLVFISFRRIFNLEIALLSTTFYSVSYFFLSSINHNPTIILFSFSLLFVFSLTLFKKKDINNYECFLIALFLAILIMIKQPTYPLVAAAFILIFWFSYKNKDIKILRILIYFIILSAPIVYYQISSTGTISPLSLYGEPVIDNIFQPKFLIIDQWQKDIDVKVNLIELERNVSRGYYTVYQPIYQGFGPTINLINLFSNNFFPPDAKDLFINAGFLTFLSFLGILIFLFNFKELDYFKIFFFFLILFTFILVFINPKVEYFIYLPTISIFLIVLGIIGKLDKRVMLLLVFIVIVLLVLESCNFQTSNRTFFSKTIMRQGIPDGYNTLLDYTNWLKINTPKDSIIMDADTPDVPFYSNRTIFWDYRLFYLNETDLLFYLKNYYNISYVVIRNPQITNTPNNFDSVPIDSAFLRVLNNEEYSKIVYDNNKVKIFQIKLNTTPQNITE